MNLPIFAVLLTLAFATPAIAGQAADALSKCLTDNTTGRDRKELARWMFVAMSVHPEIRQLSKTTPADVDLTSRTVGAIFTKLLTKACPSQSRAAVQTEGSQSMQAAFSVLGQVAMQELMSDKDVNAAIAAFERYMDTKMLEATLGR